MFYKCIILQNDLIYFINFDILSVHILIKCMFITNLSYNWLFKLKRLEKSDMSVKFRIQIFVVGEF